MTLSTSDVDVIIPVFNGQETIADALASIQSQTVANIRIIVVNDGSTDGTKAIVERLALLDERIVLIDGPNAGIVDARNTGLAACTSAVIALLDADDLARPDRLENQLSYLRSHPECVAVSGPVVHIDDAGQAVSGELHLPPPEAADYDECPQREPYLMHPFLMMRRAAVEAIGGYRHAFCAEDTDLYWRLQEVGQLGNIKEVVGCYRVHSNSITSTSLLNGRISALNSQLAGLSARRRRMGRDDIDFDQSDIALYRQAGTLKAIVELGVRGLDEEERERLPASVCAKLLELASYRPYELEPEDCAFIRSSILQRAPRMPASSRRNCMRMLSGTAARLVHEGRLAPAYQLAPVRLYPVVAARLALRALLPSSLLRVLRKATGRSVTAK